MAVILSGPIGDTGWLAMHKSGPNHLQATFVDNNITTEVWMILKGQQMKVKFKYIANGGAANNRMRIMIVLKKAEDISSEELLRLSQANCDTALDVR